MKIGILSRNPNLYSTRRLVEAAEERGHTTAVIDVLKCYADIETGKPMVLDENDIPLNDLDAIIPRIGASITSYGKVIVKQFEMSNIYTLNSSLAISRARNKLRAHQFLAKENIGMPITGFAHSPQNTSTLIKLVGGAPLIIKLLESTQGKGVVLAETNSTAETVINAFRGLNAFFLVQEFVKEANGMDIRCFVVGDQVIAAMKRQAQNGEFRSNLHRGGTSEIIELTPDEHKIAIASAKIIGLNVAGVDIIRSNRGPLVLEVNASPGLEGVEKASKKDIAGAILDYVIANATLNETNSNREVLEHA